MVNRTVANNDDIDIITRSSTDETKFPDLAGQMKEVNGIDMFSTFGSGFQQQNLPESRPYSNVRENTVDQETQQLYRINKQKMKEDP